jgi:hypothetical protein
MATTNFLIRLLGGRNLSVVYDSTAGTVTVAGQALTLSTISNALQNQFAAAIASGSGADIAVGTEGGAAFGGDNVSQAVGAIMDANPVWRAACMAAVANLQDASASCNAGT